MSNFLTESKHIRLTKEANDIVEELKKKYPGDYKTFSDVIRAGIFTLRRWKAEYENKKEE